MHPYRSSVSAPEPAAEHFEERVVGFVLLAAGAISVATGADSPTAIVLGFLLLAIGLATLRRPRVV